MKVILLAIALSVSLFGSKLNTSDHRYFKTVINIYGYPCSYAHDGRYLGKKEVGKEFKIFCDDFKFKYKVVINNNNVPIAKQFK